MHGVLLAIVEETEKDKNTSKKTINTHIQDVAYNDVFCSFV